MWLDFDVRGNRRWTISLEEVLLWIMDSYFSQKQRFEVKNFLMDLFKLLSSQDVNWWTGVVWITCGLLWCFYQLFGLSFWRHPFTAEDPLLRQWCSDTFLQIWWINKLIHILAGLRGRTFLAFFFFLWTISLKHLYLLRFSICIHYIPIVFTKYMPVWCIALFHYHFI